MPLTQLRTDLFSQYFC